MRGGRGGGVKSPIHFHCVLHAKRGEGGPNIMYNCVRTKWKAPNMKNEIKADMKDICN